MTVRSPAEQAGIYDIFLAFIAQHQQKLKWTVYALLLLNFGYYIFDDLRAAQATLTDQSSFLQITSAFATSLDELGWFVILFMLEAETYWMEEEGGPIYWIMNVVNRV
ncbi:hypothetical protein [Pseudemcibacter aquimaris]|uniref:hypothetical protein n=1 Tax=Pseudemcibacter aquimaris TaxID=2857064 RepID=UPI00201240DE|nr:hypothetical protein [Pseudemcibacter aquimaris]MCC3862098.1 hypothetical protein [Pseudemcibacter aquimaris]WDU58851.1 hypothetical protein KW060_01010 [Pseudemcibacter aquimaris]